ncbi:GH25 family lysozyme [Lactiplantibacillus pentosus]|uniref:GH25 family lysozyme n=1 Tax=Lactiplantibacillus pentosus TaxID=1589 RepID=UPI001FD689B5|nr:GH25 family lysozyme [Lactiplantibacillus pentosus]MCJ8184820.1 hypothetical protein [Lactiplantibacillus pentosus]
MNVKKLIKGGLLTAAALFFLSGAKVTASASTQPVLDLSEWQGQITTSQAKLLKGEVKGVILRVQYGSNYKDKYFVHNVKVLKAASVPYGVYAYGQYVNKSDAKKEAKVFYNRSKAYAPKFYVNDAEELTTTSGTYSTATKAFATELQSLTSKKVYLYSYQSFYTTNINSKSGYDGMWLAAYQTSAPSTSFSYQLWQYTDSRYSTSLKASTDASKFTGSNNWFGTTINKANYPYGGHILKEVVRVKAGIKFYGTSKTIDSSLTKVNLRVHSIKTVYTGKSNQVLTLYHGSTAIGRVRAQDIKASYFSSPKITKVKVVKSNGIWTHKNGKVQNHIKKGTVLKVDGYEINSGGYRRFKHSGHKTNFTANKANVKVVK